VTETDGYEQAFVNVGTDQLGLHHYPAPDSGDLAPLVTIWPAMGVPARYYRPFARALHAHGWQVVVADLRGTGTSRPRPSRRSHYGLADLVDDVGAVQETLRERSGRRRELLLGHSLGGQAILLHEGLSEQPTTDAIVLVGVGLPYFRSYPGRRAAVVLPYTQLIAATTALLGVWPGWTFGGRQARGVIRDWAYTARHGRYPRLDGVDAEAALGTVTTPVLSVSLEHDDLTPPGTTGQLTGKLAKAPVTREHYTAAAAGAPLDHFRWVRAADALAARVTAFAAG
jgi:predicted alpha/beta hydrolase